MYMKRKNFMLSCLIFSIFILFNSVVLSAEKEVANKETLPQKITLGVIPGGNPEQMRVESLELAKKIQNELSVPVEVVIAKTYGGLVGAMKSGEVQFGFLTAHSFVQSEKDVPLKVLLKKTWAGAPFYFSSVVVNKDSSIKKIKDLKSKKFAFVDKGSTSGYLYPQVMFQQNAIKDDFFSSIEYSGNHAKSVEWLEKRMVDAIATFSDDEKATSGAWSKFSQKKLKVKALWVSKPIPNDPIVVTREFYEKHPFFTHNFMSALIDIQDQAKLKKEFRQTLGDGDLLPATEKHFDPVREMVKLLKPSQ